MFIITCNIAAMLTKYFCIKTVTASGLVLMLILSLPMYALYKANSDFLVVFFVSMGAIFGIFYGNIMVLFTESLPKEIRYTGFALAYNIGFGIFGGLLPFLCFYLAHAISDYMAVGMIVISAIVGLVTLYKFEPEPLKNSIINLK
jgi:MHS family proline/betaine transporter-like MFS transporter